MTKATTTTTAAAPKQAANITIYKTAFLSPFEGFAMYAIELKDANAFAKLKGGKLTNNFEQGGARVVVSIQIGSDADKACVPEGFAKEGRGIDLTAHRSGVMKTQDSGKPPFRKLSMEKFGTLKQKYIAALEERSRQADALVRARKQMEYQEGRVMRCNEALASLRAEAKALMDDEEMQGNDHAMHYLANAVKSA